MSLNLTNFIRQISKEKDLEPDVIKDAVEQGLLAASRKNLSIYKNARVSLDLASGQLDLMVTKTIVPKGANPRTEIDLKAAKKIRPDAQAGEEIEVVIEPAEFGRIAAQSARQVIMQKLRDAEREKVYEEFKEKVGTVVTGIVQRFERRDAIVNVGRSDGVLPLNQQPFGAHYRVGDRIKVLVTEIEKTQRGPVIRLSRTDPELVIKLFEQEVPEVADGTVKIVAIAREPGVRTKVAVMSTNSDVDPVGACVGMKGSRVQMIVREFENEKIDIVPYSANPSSFITSALNPAKIIAVSAPPNSSVADVLVARGNLSLAIGKRGQNARLAARLTGWRINIKGEEETEAEAEADQMRKRYLDDLLGQIPEVNDVQRMAIAASPFRSVSTLATADIGSVAPLVNGNRELAEQIISGAQEYLEGLAEMTREAQAGAAQEAPADASETEPGAPKEEAPQPTASVEGAAPEGSESESAEADEGWDEGEESRTEAGEAESQAEAAEPGEESPAEAGKESPADGASQ
jgi:N utilization substance protein A